LTDAEQLKAIRDMTASTVADKENLAATLAAQVSNEKADVAEADDAVKRAQGRVETIERGEVVEGGVLTEIYIRQYS
jgi:hypothetical protein